MIELEKTYLAKYLPEGLKNCRSKKIIDMYLPENAEHAKLRIRKNGDRYEITKKEPITESDCSEQEESTISLTEPEFNGLKEVSNKTVVKTRYYYEYEGKTAEFDVFEEKLQGLVLIDVEFTTTKEKDLFEMPDFCLKEITQEEFIAGGVVS